MIYCSDKTSDSSACIAFTPRPNTFKMNFVFIILQTPIFTEVLPPIIHLFKTQPRESFSFIIHVMLIFYKSVLFDFSRRTENVQFYLVQMMYSQCLSRLKFKPPKKKMFNKCKNGQDCEFEKHIRTWLLVEEPYLLRDLWKIVLEFAQPLMWRPCGEHHNPLLTCLYCAQKMRIPSNLCIRHLIAEGDNFLYPFIRHPSRDDAISFSNILI